jgi:transcriptional repressor NF-X1
LVEKKCICGKKSLKNQPCWFEEVRCGLPCGKTLKCGNHQCNKPCHRPGQCEDADMAGSHCSQPCGKARKSCDHTCTEQCHAPDACKEDKPCQSKAFITCACQRRKQEIRCLATRLNDWPEREQLKCDDECLRLERNARLAAALNIDPDTHTDDHVPYSDTTLKLFKESTAWAQAQEREFRVFAGDSAEKRMRFRPMPAHQRAFLHALAEDFGLDSESQDPEPHRHVCLFKTPRFVSAPRKTLAQCIRATAAAPTPRASTAGEAGQAVNTYNAFLLTKPRFGLTVEELDAALATDLASARRSASFATSFLPASDEVAIKAAPVLTAASIATGSSSSTTTIAQSLETTLTALKPAVARTVSQLGLAGDVLLCRISAGGMGGGSTTVVRREGETARTGTGGSGAGGWSTVASKASWRKPGPAVAQQPAGATTSRTVLSLRKKKDDEEAKKTAPVVEHD